MGNRRARRRRYKEDFKRRVVAEASAADVSVSAVARRHGLNANLVFNWRKKFGGEIPVAVLGAALQEPWLLPVEIKAEATTEPAALPSHSMLEIILPCGSHIRCSAGVDPALFGHAVVALRPGNVTDAL